MFGTLFAVAVIYVSVHNHSYFVPIFLGAFTWLKATLGAWLKLASPQLAVAIAKNSMIIKLRDTIVKVLTEFAVFTHRPWRRRALALKQYWIDVSLKVLRAYIASPLWLRCLVAIGLLGLTAGSTWVALALLIVPQAILEWLKKRMLAVLQKLGVLRVVDVAWRAAVPPELRQRWERYRRWTLGRRQIRASRDIRRGLSVRRRTPDTNF